MKQMTDIELLTLLQENNEAAFACIMDRYSSVLLRHISRRLNSTVDAAEIVQDIFLSLWQKREHIYTTDSSLYPYLFRAAKYEIINRIIKNNRQIVKYELLTESYSADTLFTTEEHIIASELRQVLYSAVDKMPTTMRTVFYLSREECLSIKDIAIALSLSEQTVKNNLTMALKQLRFVLGRNHYISILLISITIHIKNMIS